MAYNMCSVNDDDDDGDGDIGEAGVDAGCGVDDVVLMVVMMILTMIVMMITFGDRRI